MTNDECNTGVNSIIQKVYRDYNINGEFPIVNIETFGHSLIFLLRENVAFIRLLVL